MRTRGGIWTRNPRIVSVTDGENEGGGDSTEGDHQNEPAFPANTPVKDMTPEQQAAYWQDKARKHEGRVKAFGDFTPEKLAQLQKDADELRKKSQSAEQNALEEATEKGRAEARAALTAELASERVKHALERELNGRVPDSSALLDLDRTRFIKGDGADVDAIKAWVAENSTEGSGRKGGPDLGQGKRGNNQPVKGVGAGADLFAGKRKSKTTTES